MSKKEFKVVNTSSCGNIGEYEYISSGVYEEKKSKFYAYIFQVYSPSQALEIIDEAKKQYKDARHVVYSYVIGDVYKYSDDGEPSGTAGKMIYSLLEKQKVTNVLVIIVRYFGGILLGAGNLSRAYLKAAKMAENDLELIDYENRVEISLNISYNDEDLLRKLINKVGAEIINVEYNADIVYNIKITEKDINLFDRFQKV